MQSTTHTSVHVMWMVSSEGKLRPAIPEIDYSSGNASNRQRSSTKRRLSFVASIVVLLVLVLGVFSVMVPGDPIGSEFAVNTYVQDAQITPSAAMNISGNSIAVWSSYAQDGSGYGVYGQMLDSSGAKTGSEFIVNNYTMDDQKNPATAMRPNGTYVVVWQSLYDYTSTLGTYIYDITAKQYDSEGDYVPDPMLPPWIGEHPDYIDPAIAVSGDTLTAVVWTSDNASGQDVFAHCGDFTQWPTANHFTVNTYTSGDQAQPAVAMDEDGDVVVVWRSEGQDGSSGGIYGQRFLSDESPVGSEFLVNSYTSGDQTEPSVSMDSAGNFVVVWSSYDQDGDGWGVYGQRFSSIGMKVGSEFRVNTYTSSDQNRPSVSMSASGEFVVVWASAGQDGSGWAVVGQRYYNDGVSMGTEFLVNSYHSGDQTLPCVSCNDIGDFIVVWQSDGQDGSSWGVYAQLHNRLPIPEAPLAILPMVGTAAMVLLARRRSSSKS